MARDIDRHMNLRTTATFGPIIASTCAAFGCRLQGSVSEIAAEGYALRFCAHRRTSRRSRTSVSNTLTLSQRWLCWLRVYQGAKHGVSGATQRLRVRSSGGHETPRACYGQAAGRLLS